MNIFDFYFMYLGCKLSKESQKVFVYYKYTQVPKMECESHLYFVYRAEIVSANIGGNNGLMNN